jgi:hypothetical protein
MSSHFYVGVGARETIVETDAGAVGAAARAFGISHFTDGLDPSSMVDVRELPAGLFTSARYSATPSDIRALSLSEALIRDRQGGRWGVSDGTLWAVLGAATAQIAARRFVDDYASRPGAMGETISVYFIPDDVLRQIRSTTMDLRTAILRAT